MFQLIYVFKLWALLMLDQKKSRCFSNFSLQKIGKWSGGGKRQVPKGREGGGGGKSTRGGFPQSRKREGGGVGGFSPGKFLNYRRLYVRFNAFWKLLGGQNFSHFGQ